MKKEELIGRLHEAVCRQGLTRREMLRYTALALASSIGTTWTTRPVGAALTDIEMDDFLAAASALCGLDVYDPGKGKPYWDHFKTDDTLPALTQLVDLLETTPPDKINEAVAAARLDQLASSIVSAFYSGQLIEGNKIQLVTYWDALVWQAVKSFTKPPGVCGGGFGYWAEAPKSTSLA
jgi:hypothetical protein